MDDLWQHLPADAISLGGESFRQVGHIDLVVPTPQDKRGVIAEFGDDAFRLLSNPIQEILLLRISTAGEGEILPNHDSLLVTEIKEGMVFINVPAPAANHIASQVFHQRQGLVHPLPIPTVEGVQGNPICPFYHNRYFVDVQQEMAGWIWVLIYPAWGWVSRFCYPGSAGAFCPCYLNGPDSNSLHPFCQHFPTALKLYGNRVNIWIAIAFRPPKFRRLEGDPTTSAAELDRTGVIKLVISTDSMKMQLQIGQVFFGGVKSEPGPQDGFPLREFCGPKVNIINPGFRHGLQPD
jgi:hypothetical protein